MASFAKHASSMDSLARPQVDRHRSALEFQAPPRMTAPPSAGPRGFLAGLCWIVVRGVAVVAPFGHVAVHVVEAPGVGLLLADRCVVLAALSANQAYSAKAGSVAEAVLVSVPARQAYSHSASVGSR